MELTAKQIADGWIAVPDDCMTMPAELIGIELADIMMSSAHETRDPTKWVWSIAANTAGRIRAYRICKPTAPQAATLADPNAAMLAADERPAYDVKAMAGNGCIFGTPRAEKCNLLTVAPISATGFSVWGCHD